MLALLGTFSIAGHTEAEEVLRDPVILERLLRGGLSALALMLVAPLLFDRLRTGRGSGHRAVAALVCYVLIAVLSTLYSAAPLVTLAKAFELMAGLAPVVAVAYGPKPRQRLSDMLLLVILSQALLVMVAAIGFFVLPATFAYLESRPGFIVTETLFPPYAHSNAMASISAIVGMFSLACAIEARSPRWLWRTMAVISVGALVLASGRQGVAMYLVGITLVLWVRRRRFMVLALVPAVVGLVWTYGDSIIEALTRDRPSNFVNITGRLGFWEAAVATWERHPWTGWGFGSGGRFVVLENLGRGGTSSLHSGYFEALTGVGILGFIPLVYAVVRIVAWAISELRARSDVAAAALIFLLLLRTAVSLGFGGWLTVEFVLFAILAAMSDESRARKRAVDRFREYPVPVVSGR